MPIFTKEFSTIGKVFGFLAGYAPGRSSNETPGTPQEPPSQSLPPKLDPELDDLDARFQEIEDQMKEILVDIKIHLCKTQWDDDIFDYVTLFQEKLKVVSSKFF